MRFFKGYKPPFRGVVYRPDSRTLITANQNGLVTLWDLDTTRELTRLAGNPGIGTIAISPDGRLLAAVGNSLTVWDLQTGKAAAGFDSATLQFLRGAAFALNGSRLVVSAHSGPSYDFSQCGLAMWDTADGKTLPLLENTNFARSLTTSPDGESVFEMGSYDVTRWHLPTGKQHRTQFGHSLCAMMAASPTANIVAHGLTRTVEIRDANGERLLAQLDAHKKAISALAFSPDGKFLATGGLDGFVKLWDVSVLQSVLANPSAQPLIKLREHKAFDWGLGPVRGIAFSPDGTTAAAVGDKVKFVVWDLE
jgi:WD40 repeat protein